MYTVFQKNWDPYTHGNNYVIFFVLMAYPFCHINYDLFPINFVIFNKVLHTVYEMQMFKKLTLVY